MVYGEPYHALTPKPKRIIVALTSATGTILGIRLLQRLRQLNVESHLIISKWAAATLKYETSYSVQDVMDLADKVYSYKEQSATISSGSVVCGFVGMIIFPCSMKTLAGVRIGYADDLISRAADVVLKERRRLVMVVRETPLSCIHLENMLALTRAGAVMFPPVPAFYTRPEYIDDVVEQSVRRILNCFGIETGEFQRWDRFGGAKQRGKWRFQIGSLWSNSTAAFTFTTHFNVLKVYENCKEAKNNN